MQYTRRPFQYDIGYPQQVKTELEKANDNFEILWDRLQELKLFCQYECGCWKPLYGFLHEWPLLLFVIGDFVYFVHRLSDENYSSWLAILRYDTNNDTWCQVATGSFNDVQHPIYFNLVIDDYGFVLCDTGFYRYNSRDNTWVQVNFNDEVTHLFLTNGYIYGLSYHFLDLKALWQYDHQTDVWVKIRDYDIELMKNTAISHFIFVKDFDLYFTLNIYIPMDPDPLMFPMFIKFNVMDGSIAQVANLPFDIINRSWFTSFSNEMFCFVTCGFIIDDNGNINYFNDLWRFDATRNSWKRLCNVPGGGRAEPIGFIANSYIYIGGGSLVDNPSLAFKDLWRMRLQ